MTKTETIIAQARSLQDEIKALAHEAPAEVVAGWEIQKVPAGRFGDIMQVRIATTTAGQEVGPYLLPRTGSVCLCVLEGSIVIGDRIYSKTDDPDQAFAVIPSSAGREVYAVDRPSAVAFCLFLAGGENRGEQRSEVDARKDI